MWPSPVFVKACATPLLSIVLFSQSAQLQAKDRFALGGGVRDQSSVYRDVDSQQSVLPDFELQYGRFFLKGKELGWSLLPESVQRHTFTAGVSKDLLNGKRDDARAPFKDNNSNNDTRLKDVSTGINLKLGWHYKLTDHQAIKLALLQDVGNEHQGQQAEVSWSYQQTVGHWILIPEVSGLWFSQPLKQHYFALPQERFNGSGLAHSAALKLAYPFSQHWLFNGKLQFRQFENDLRRSAIVSRNHNHSLYIGLRYYW